MRRDQVQTVSQACANPMYKGSRKYYLPLNLYMSGIALAIDARSIFDLQNINYLN